MRLRLLVLGLSLGVAGSAGHSLAATNTLVYSLNGATPVSLTAEVDTPTINVGSVNGTVTLRIWDDDPDLTTGLPDDGIGKITISGSWSSGELRVLIAGTGDSWPGAASIELTDPGLRDLGLNSGDGIEITDSDLRKHTRLAAYVSGDINGAIEVGQVQRIQCGFSTTNPTPGNINASITAIAPDALWGVDSIGRVYAGNSIVGNLTATGDSSFDPIYSSTYASIGRVVVGPDTGAAGITGDIKAEKGKIRAIYSTGPIGSETTTPKIYAANGIDEIRAIAESAPGTYVASDFKADVRANVAYTAQLAYSTTEDATIFLIRTAGGIGGQIRAGNVSWGPNLTPVHRGIMADGPITADILIDLNLENADILGSSITGDVRIGLKAKGAIVATSRDETDPDAGRIESVWIGHGESLPANYEEFYPRGFVGNDAYPVIRADPADWYTPDPNSLDVGTQDSVIRGTSIGEIRLASMTQTHVRLYANSNWKGYIPRLESPVIESLEIGDMRAGVVWSGALDLNQFGGIENDPTNDYAEIAELSIGCVGPGSDVWFKDCPRAEILNDLLGELHVPVLTAAEVIWIGDRIGDGPPAFSLEAPGDRCGACVGFNEWECFYSYGGLIEDSPRDTGYADKGAVIIRDAQGLAGQIIINGNNTELAAGTGWKGTVTVGAEDPESEDYIVLGPEEDSPYEAPHYLSPSGPLGGGAVGLAPFAFYPTDCIPPHGEIGIDDGPTYTEFVSDTSYPVILRWYGPIGLPRESVDNIAIECNNPSSGCEWFDLTVVFDPIVHPFDQLRAMGLRGGSGVPKDGVYRIRYLEVVEGESLVEDRFYCDDVLDIVRVGAFPENECDVETPDLPAYLFRIQRDCNGNGHPDAEDIAGNSSLDTNENGYIDSCEPVVCECDWDGDGTVAVIDIFAFLTDWFANDTAAQNFGGTPGVAAIFAFLNCWFEADPDEPC